MECREATHVGDAGRVEDDRRHPTLPMAVRGIWLREGEGRLRPDRDARALENFADWVAQLASRRAAHQHRALDERRTGRIPPELGGAGQTGELELHAASRIATTPWPPAAQI